MGACIILLFTVLMSWGPADILELLYLTVWVTYLELHVSCNLQHLLTTVG